jgi:2-amino-4-hydroxy-6-hydroxymethyldihydropteridine diphosphokinase / dihydropteroate synthase
MLILGLGSNVGDRLHQLRSAYRFLQESKDFNVEALAPIYMSQAQLHEGAPNDWNRSYLNTAVRCSTSLKPFIALKQLQAIEAKMGRSIKHSHWGPRTIDIDILYWSEYPSIQSEILTLPHAHLFERPFALWPLEDLVCDKIMVNLIDRKTNCAAKDISRQWNSRFNKNAPFQTHQLNHRIDTPCIMGILNVTPNSFSDDGICLDSEKALQRSIQLFEAGANIIDIGSESTRPHNTDTLSPQEEWNRIYPVLEAIRTHWQGCDFRPKISIDTRSPRVAERALSFDIDFINDVTGFTNPLMLTIAQQSHVKLIFMHHLSIPPSKDNVLPLDKDPIDRIKIWAIDQQEKILVRGIDLDRIIFDPGIGFGKTPCQNIEIIKRANEFSSLKLPILIGHSRKSFLERFVSVPPSKRDIETAMISVTLAKKNIDYLRIHDVESTMRALKVAKVL